MAGVLAGSPIFVSQYLGSNPTTSQASQPAYPVIIAKGIIDIHGQKVNHLPIENVAAGVDAGDICKQFQFDYYYRIYVTPSVVDLGNLISTQIRSFEVWNAHFDPKLNSDLTFVGDTTGIILTEPEAVPTTFGALENRTYELNFALTGPASIAIEYTWSFPGEFPTLTAFGNRVILFTFAPDWSEEVTERYEYLTQINESDDGYEDRYRLRVNPRRSIEYRMLIQQREKRWLERYMWSWKGRAFSVPIWTDCSVTTAEVGPGLSNIPVVTTEYTSFRVGGVAILLDGFASSEAVEILNVNPTSIDTVRPTLALWPEGTKIYPALTGRMKEDAGITMPTADVDFGRIRFEYVDNEAIPAVEAPTAYQDGFVLERAPNRAQDLDVTWQSKYGLVDFGIAQPLVDERAAFPDQVTSFTFAAASREEIWFWKQWLEARGGKWSKFYMSSWSVDFEVVTNIDFNDNALEVVDNQYRDFYDGAVAKRDIVIYTTDGQVYYRRITSAAEKAPEGSGVEILFIDGQLGTDYTIDEVKMVSFLHPVRLDGDGVDFNWDHTQMSRINFNTRVIQR